MCTNLISNRSWQAIFKICDWINCHQERFCCPLIQPDIGNECFASDDQLTLYRLSNAVPACCTPIHDSQKPTDTENRAIGIRTQCWKETLELEERSSILHFQNSIVLSLLLTMFIRFSIHSVIILLANHQNTRPTDLEWSVENSPEIGRGEHNQHEQDVRAEHDRTTWI